jgi:hypothetical protein
MGNIHFSMLEMSAFPQTKQIKNKKDNVTVVQQEGTPSPFQPLASICSEH